MTKIIFYIFFALVLVFLPLSNAISGVPERNIFLTRMLSLSEKPKPYFFINMGENKILLMAKGIVLREWVADKIRFTQGYLPIQTLTLEKKNIQLAELRHAEPIVKDDAATSTNVKNTSDSKTVSNATVDLKTKSEYKPPPALDIEDMPADYQLFLNGGISIDIVSQAESYKSIIKRYLITPILALWPSSKKDDMAKIEIFFKDKTNSRTLFWSFTEGTDCIILPPGSGDKKDFQF
jgi:hypothetical protein